MKGLKVLNGFTCHFKIILIAIFLVCSINIVTFGQTKEFGQLRVIGTQLSDQRGNALALHGASFGWSCFHPRFYTEGTVNWLKKDWNCTVLRAAMGVEPKKGYLEDKQTSEGLITAVVDAAIKADLYVIIDWHSHNIRTEEAVDFFDSMSKKYNKYPNVIYEIFNEPERIEWSEVKAYSEKLIKTIRANDPDNIILVGCPHWDQDIDKVAADPIKNVTNVMYTMHFYAGTHKKWLRDRTDDAISKGIPVFISECAGVEATGDGPLDLAEWHAYVEWMDKHKLSWLTWSVSDKNETCSMVNVTASSEGNWKESDLKASGIRTRDYLKNYDKSGIKKNRFECKGRVEKLSDSEVILIGSASSVSFMFSGNRCEVKLKSLENHHNWVAIEVDGKYEGRIKIEAGEARNYPISMINKNESLQLNSDTVSHIITIYKATEASNGGVLFNGDDLITEELAPQTKKKKIEFIGNSITCGYGADETEIPCGKGEWYDQHNAYMAFGPMLSRNLGVDYMLSSVSGIGMYRNWNSENQEESNMPDVYQNLYLDKNINKPFSNDYQPDLVSICLGTNDLSEGDGIKNRIPFNEDKFISNYIEFVKMIYNRYPETHIVLLSSPMLSNEKNALLINCLNKIKAEFNTDSLHKSIEIFQFKPMIPAGCDYHPSMEDHARMAEELEPFIRNMLE